MKRITLFDLPVDALTMQQTLSKIDRAIRKKEMLHHVVINAAKVVNAKKNPELRKSIVDCDLINADGQAVVWASRFLKQPLPERVAGIDLMENLVKQAAIKNYRIFFLGATEEVVNKVVNHYKDLYGEEILAGYRNGYFAEDQELSVAEEISISKADILFVAMSSPKKEIFLETHKNLIQVPFIMGVGGSFDVISGLVKRAPVWMQKAGLEWFYRVIQEPGRMWKRYLFGNAEFMYLVFKEKFQLN